MPRKPRLFVSGATYHVYCRVARGEHVFDDAGEASGFTEVVRDTCELDGCRILAWCLMGNHYHLVVSTRTVPLWRSMARLQGRVARGFNRRRRYLGRLWQSRYKARLIDSHDDFRQVVAYVHLNPVSAGIVTDPAESLNSGHRAILGLCRPLLVDVAAVLRGFDGPPRTDPRDEYLGWLRAVAEARWLSDGLENLPWWTGAQDTDEIADSSRHPEATTFDGHSAEDNRRHLDFEEFIRRFNLVSRCSLKDLASRMRAADIVRGRVELTTLAVARYGLRSSDVARLIRKDLSSTTRWLNTGLRLQQADPNFRQRLDALDCAVSDADPDNATMQNVAP